MTSARSLSSHSAMPGASARAPGRRRFSWLWAALVVSLAANAFIIGHLLVERMSGGHRHDPQARIMQMELRFLADRLPPAAVTKVTAALDTLQPDIAARLEKLKALRAELGVLSAAPTPDRAAIDAHLRDIRLEVGAMQEQVQSRTFDALLALPTDERAPLAQPSKDN